MDRLARGTFIGRAQEMDQGRSLVEDAFSGRVNFLLIDGEQGIGKTRLADEIATYSTLRGAKILWGSLLQGSGSAPLLALGAGPEGLRKEP